MAQLAFDDDIVYLVICSCFELRRCSNFEVAVLRGSPGPGEVIQVAWSKCNTSSYEVSPVQNYMRPENAV